MYVGRSYLIWFRKKAIYSNARPPAFDQQCPYFGITDVHIHAAFRRWQAWPGRTHPDISRPCLSHHVQCSTAHALVPFENPFSSDRHVADGAGRGTGRIRSRTDLWLPASDHSYLVVPRSPCTLRRCTSALSASSGSRTCSWMNCAPGCAAPTRFSGSGWLSIPSPRLFLCLSSAHVHKPWPIG
jgi:hypothetical protein